MKTSQKVPGVGGVGVGAGVFKTFAAGWWMVVDV